MKELIERISDYFKNITKKDLNKWLPNIIVALMIGILIMFYFKNFSGGNDDSLSYLDNISNDNSSVNEENNIKDYSTLIERRLENILSQIQGVGKVKVMVTIEETIEKIPAKNTITTKEKTTENDSEGGTREITREDKNEQVVLSNNSLAVIKEVNPKISGVIVVAQGVDDIKVKEILYNAVKTVLGIPGNKVEIYSGK